MVGHESSPTHRSSDRDLHDCGAGIGSALPAGHGRRALGWIDAGDGGRDVHVRDGGRDDRRHALLSDQSACSNRWRQVRLHRPPPPPPLRPPAAPPPPPPPPPLRPPPPP